MPTDQENTDKYTSREIFVAYNNHCDDCSVPPKFTTKDRKPGEHYYGYYENCHGEQFIFVYSFITEQGIVYGGDCGWKEPMKVEEFLLADLREKAVADNLGSGWADFKDNWLDHGRGLGAMITLDETRFIAIRDICMNHEEMKWLKACWLAARHFRSSRKKACKEVIIR